MAQDRVRADKGLAAALGVKAGDGVFHSAIVHEENGVAVQFEERWINPAVAPGYLEQDFTVRTPHRYLIMCAPITEVEHVLHAIRPDRRVREFLRITADEPCLLLARRTWSGPVMATRSTFIYPGGRYSLGGRYKVMGEAERPVLGSMQSGEMYRPNASPTMPDRDADGAKRKRLASRRRS
jgi:GntR family histidine utilization transcriptional repressor